MRNYRETNEWCHFFRTDWRLPIKISCLTLRLNFIWEWSLRRNKRRSHIRNRNLIIRWKYVWRCLDLGRRSCLIIWTRKRTRSLISLRSIRSFFAWRNRRKVLTKRSRNYLWRLRARKIILKGKRVYNSWIRENLNICIRWRKVFSLVRLRGIEGLNFNTSTRSKNLSIRSHSRIGCSSSTRALTWNSFI